MLSDGTDTAINGEDIMCIDGGDDESLSVADIYHIKQLYY